MNGFSRIRVLTTTARTELFIVVAAVAVAIGFAWFAEGHVAQLSLAVGAQRAIDQVELGVIQHVDAVDFQPPFTEAKLASLSARLDPLARRAMRRGSDIVRVNIFARDGTILYSDLVSLRGQTVSPFADRQLGAALAGTTTTEIDDLNALQDADLKARYPGALESYIPLVINGEVVGAYDLYQDLTPFEPLRLLVRAMVGVVWILVALLATAVALLRRRGVIPVAVDQVIAAQPDAGPELTGRERDVLRLMATDCTYRQIAHQLCVGEETVRTHAKSILRKLGQPDRAQAVRAGVKAGLLELEPTVSSPAAGEVRVAPA